MEKFFSINDYIDIPSDIYVNEILGQYVVVAYNKPNWLVLNAKEHEMFSLIDKNKKIINILEEYIESNKNLESDALKCMQSLLQKIELNSFYENITVTGNEPIENIKKNIQLHLTHACNMQCIHCYMAAGHALHNELDEESWIIAINKISKLIPDTEIVFTGGEPLIREDCFRIMKHAKRLGHKVILFTNGTLINEMNIKKVLESTDEIQISFEGITKVAYEYVRGLGNYEKFIQAIQLVVENDIPLTLAVTVIHSNIDDIKDNFPNMLKKLNSNKINIRINDTLEKEGYAKELPNQFFAHSVYVKTVLNELKITLKKLGYMEEKRHKKNMQFNNCGIGCSITVDSSGDIYPCSKFINVRGNIITDNLQEVIQLFDDLNKNSEIEYMICNKCELKYICSGGCRIDNYLETGSFTTPICNYEYKQQIYRDLINER